jgi:putative membrane protein
MLKSFLIRWVNTTVAVLVAANVINGISYTGWQALVVASLLLGILNAFIRPFLIIVALPLLILTLGLFTFVINAVLLYWVGHLVKGFHVETFWPAFWGALVVSFISMLLNTLTGTNQSRITYRRGGPPPPPNRPGDGGGPVIDV